MALIEYSQIAMKHQKVELKTKLIIIVQFTTSGYLWPSGTVKSPGFFKFGSCFSFF